MDPGNPAAPGKVDPGKADPGKAAPGNPAYPGNPAPGNLVVFEPRRHRRRVLNGEFAFAEKVLLFIFSANIHCRVPEQDSVSARRHVDMEEIMQGFGIVFLTALIFCACGFYMYIYFFSLGYGFSIAAIGAVLLFMFRGTVSAGTAAQCLLFIIYGLRLGGYLLIRDLRSSSYRKVLDPELKRSRAMGIVPKLSIWISCALLYTLQTSPVLFRLQNGDGTNLALTAGAVIMFLGVVIETLADYALPQLFRRDTPVDGRPDQRDRLSSRNRPVGVRRRGISAHNLCYVQRRQTAGTAAGQKLREGSGISKVYCDSSHYPALYPALQCEKV